MNPLPIMKLPLFSHSRSHSFLLLLTSSTHGSSTNRSYFVHKVMSFTSIIFLVEFEKKSPDSTLRTPHISKVQTHQYGKNINTSQSILAPCKLVDLTGIIGFYRHFIGIYGPFIGTDGSCVVTILLRRKLKNCLNNLTLDVWYFKWKNFTC